MVRHIHALAVLLAAPQDGSLEALAEMAAGPATWLQEAVVELQATPLAEWQAEHTRLFISGHPRTVCPPFESVWREGRMLGNSLEQVRGLYARSGFVPSVDLPADYLGNELEWLAGLLAEEALDEGLFAEAVEHLRGWVPPFAQALRQESRLELYRALGQKLEALFA